MKVSVWISSLLLAVSLACPSARCEQVVFSEIMYHPATALPEYIEVYNNTATPMDIADWRLAGGVDYTFPPFDIASPQRTFLKPFDRILLAGVDEATLRASYTIPVTTRIYGPWTGSLDNAGERVTLKDKNGVALCSVEYNNRGYWPVAADGTGHSLELVNPDAQIDDGRNWTFSLKPGGTPGSEQPSLAETPIASPEVNLSVGIPYIDYGDTWKYDDKNVNLGIGWRATSYDDSTWAEGRGLLGFENEAVPGPGMQTPFNNARQLTFYLRKSFVYNGSLAGVTITLDQVIDDGVVYYLNGKELARSGMAAGTVSFTTTASRTVGNATEETGLSTSNSGLVNGTNVLAAEVHQVTATSSDVVFGMRLNIALPVESNLLINEVLPAAAGTGFVEIYNQGSTTVNLRNDYLTDDPANLKKFRISQDLTIAAGGLGTVGFAESGLAIANPLKVYLVASDGTTLLSAINGNVTLDGRSVGRKPTGGGGWYLFTQPTPGSANMSQDRPTEMLAINEVHFAGSGNMDWLELYNGGTRAVSLDGLSLCSKADLSGKVALWGAVPPKGLASQDVSLAPSGDEVTVFLVDACDVVLSAAAFRRLTAGDGLQAFPQGSSEWYSSNVSSRNAANNPTRNTDIVISEILYHPPSDERSGEFIELYNRGSAAVDLSGWRFTEGVDFVFPAGKSLAAGGYLVLAADAAWMTATYGAIPAIGDFQGQLSDSGEKVRLVDASGNLADEVDYRTGGAWPDLADGGGSSLELINPFMDNSLASAWRESDETNRTSLQHYGFSGVYQQLMTAGAEADYKELQLNLVGDGEIVLSNVQVRRNGSGANLLANTGRMSTNGRSADGWLAQGTHYATYLKDGLLHVVSDGHGDNRANRVEIDISAKDFVINQTYEVSFDARWLSGTARLVIGTWDHSIATSVALPIPSDLGTPGRRNSQHKAEPAPQIDGLTHAPAVPSPGKPVMVTARVQSPSPSPTVTLYHRLDNETGSGVWTAAPMLDDGSGGDLIAEDGLYTATLTQYGGSGQIAQYYVAATAGNQTSQLPRVGKDRPGLLVYDAAMPAGDLRRMRFILSALDLQTLQGGNAVSSVYGYAFPRLSNHYFNMTLIINEQDVVHGCELRDSGSPWTRAGSRVRGKFHLPKDSLFRGKDKLTYDDHLAGGQAGVLSDRLARYWLYLIGHPVNENEFTMVKVNSGAAAFHEEVEPVANDLLNRVYESGSQGELYRIDDEWWFSDDWQQQPSQSASWNYKGTDNPGRYRTEWIKRTRENEDDYSALISVFKKAAAGYDQLEIERLVDPLAVMKMCAVRGYIADWDFFSMERGKNGYFYRRPTDGLFMFLHWDSDLAFQTGRLGMAFYSGMTGFRPYLEQPYNLRLFKHYLAVLVENWARQSARLEAWLSAEEAASTQYAVSSVYKNWFESRESYAFNFLGAGRSTAFAITTNSGNTISTSADTLSLSGSGPLRALKVQVAGHPEALFSWVPVGTAVSQMTWTWMIEGILLHSGRNDLTVQALDDNGQVLAEDAITVNKTGNAPPAMAIKADPGSWRVSVLDSMAMDVLNSHDPEGSVLTYAWTLAPADGMMDASGQDKAYATFPHPGLYTISVTGQDSEGGSATVEREIAAYAPEDSTSFSGPHLEPYWTSENLVLRPNYTAGPYYSLTEIPGQLVLQVLDDKALPLLSTAPRYPVLWRPVPASTDWAFLTKVRSAGQVFNDFSTGLIVAMSSSGTLTRYAFGIEDGTLLTVRRATASGVGMLLKAVPWEANEAEIRIRRTAGRLWFEERANGVWEMVYSLDLTGGTAAKAGLFVATDTAQRIKSAFEYATLVDPEAAGSALRQALRLSEIMYSPTGGSDCEFVELVNIGDSALDLTGVHFTAGLDYTFGPLSLSPGQCVVVASDPASFGQRYGAASGLVLQDGFSGKLDNAGETIELSDRDGEVILSVTYGAAAPWPTEADGTGRSLEVIDPAKGLNDPTNWRASEDALGSPGRL